MPCTSCGQRRAAISEAQAQAQAVTARPHRVAKYYVTHPGTGDVKEFTDHQEAATYKRSINGILTTTTG